MSGLVSSWAKGLNFVDPLVGGAINRQANGSPLTARSAFDSQQVFLKRPPTVPPLPGAPNQDTAANAAAQQQDEMRRRRGVLANIYAGGTNQPAPVVSTKQLLGQ